MASDVYTLQYIQTKFSFFLFFCFLYTLLNILLGNLNFHITIYKITENSEYNYLLKSAKIYEHILNSGFSTFSMKRNNLKHKEERFCLLNNTNKDVLLFFSFLLTARQLIYIFFNAKKIATFYNKLHL